MSGRRNIRPNAFSLGILRTVRGSLKRFVALATITALGVTMLTGLRAACVDLRNSADAFFDEQHLFDVRVQSTLGLTDEDVEALAALDGVELAEGGWAEAAYTTVGSASEKVDVKALSPSGMNEPAVLEGRLPEASDEIAVTARYLKDSGLALGDTVTFHGDEDDEPAADQDEKDQDEKDQDEKDDGPLDDSSEVFERRDYTIVGSVLDPMEINAGEGTMSFRSSGASQYSFFLTPDCVTAEVYTVVYLTVEGASDPLCYSADYEKIVDDVMQNVEDARGERERARGESLRADATEEVDEAEAEALEELADAEQEIEDGQAELDDGRAEVADGQAELDEQRADALAQLDDAQATIDDGRAELEEGSAQLDDARQELEEGIREYNEALPGAEQQLKDGQAQLDAARDELYSTTIPGLEVQRDEVEATIDTLTQTVETIDDGVAEMADGIDAMAQSLPQGGDELSEIATGVRDSWAEVVSAAQDGDKDDQDDAVEGFSDALGEAATTLTPVSESLAQTVEQLSAQAEKLPSQIESIDEGIAQLDLGIDQAEKGVAAIDEQLAALEAGEAPEDDQKPDDGVSEDVGEAEAPADSEASVEPETAEDDAADEDPEAPVDPEALADPLVEALLAKRAELQATLDALLAQREELSATREQAVLAQEAIPEQLKSLEESQEGLQQIISLGTADPKSDESAAAMARGRIQAADGLVQARDGLAQLESGIAQAKATAEAEFPKQQALIDQGWQDLRNAYEQLVSAQEIIEQSERELADGYAELESGQAELDEQRADALAQLADAQQQLDDALAEIAEGQAELDDARATFEQERSDALAEIADAREEIEDIPDATWYVQDRSSLSSYASVDSDASSIEAIGTVIPVVFFVVAVLISLTTMTRMVEEERGLVGLYKALGYGRARILSKYVLYALAACLFGGVVGNVLGYVVLPAIIFTIFSTMYALPYFLYGFDPLWALAAFALFAAGIVGATLITCWREMRESPASLMLPKAPKAGSRIFLEYIGPVWSRLGFLNKVTARNLFRYKRRFFMTVFGIAGCVALLVTGFGIRDTVISLSPRQYGDAGVIAYDLMAVTSTDDLDAVVDDLLADDEVSDLVLVYIDSLTVSFGEDKESVQLIVVPEGSSVEDYVKLEGASGEVSLDEAQAVITKNAEQVMGLSVGSVIHLQDSTLAEGEAHVGAIVDNYLGNTLYMTEAAYEEAFDQELEPNGVLAHLTGDADEQIALSERLSADGRYLSVVSTQKLVNDFSSAFTLINTVVYVVIILAAALSFTVVFTLSNTNISERERELATIKVLGFKRPEVHRYINKETLILTGIGVVVGLPVGYALARSLTWILRMPSLYFDVVVDPLTYVVSAVLAFAFTLVVNLITNRSLDRIDMVGALKSAE
ncbi:FtsX-like permease family protein [Thermophilibacter provencensis]|uniref:FtsX-like permease family protein n=1 Tax=Thermophilibacter provencensis TaxID=1852386 RepID=A0ABT7V4Y6_9ACTN|nr:FtsX-like permease family protein [Thermophilibacter provencensis]MDM8271660.1 FtsX-like permease family protein [Thermophilibacter provencensis]